VIPGATHNDPYLAGGKEYVEKWKEFVDKERSAAGLAH
jgi:hypothetical protein